MIKILFALSIFALLACSQESDSRYKASANYLSAEKKESFQDLMSSSSSETRTSLVQDQEILRRRLDPAELYLFEDGPTCSEVHQQYYVLGGYASIGMTEDALARDFYTTIGRALDCTNIAAKRHPLVTKGGVIDSAQEALCANALTSAYNSCLQIGAQGAGDCRWRFCVYANFLGAFPYMGSDSISAATPGQQVDPDMMTATSMVAYCLNRDCTDSSVRESVVNIVRRHVEITFPGSSSEKDQYASTLANNVFQAAEQADDFNNDEKNYYIDSTVRNIAELRAQAQAAANQQSGDSNDGDGDSDAEEENHQNQHQPVPAEPTDGTNPSILAPSTPPAPAPFCWFEKVCTETGTICEPQRGPYGNILGEVCRHNVCINEITVRKCNN